MYIMEAGRGRKGPSYRRTSGADINLVAGQGWQWWGNGIREGGHRLVRETPQSARNGRELQTSGAGRRVGAPSKCTVAPRLVYMGEVESGESRERSGVNR